jgi:hypothetical protein
MPRNGSGTYSAPSGSFNPAVNGQQAQAADWNTTRDDYSSALTQSLAKDGQTVPTANLPMGGFKHTGVAAAATTTDYARFDQVQKNSSEWCGTSSGTDTITATVPFSGTFNSAGQKVSFKAGGTNTGAATFNGVTIKKLAAALVAGDITADDIVELEHDGTNAQMLSPARTPVLTALAIKNAAIDTGAIDNTKLNKTAISGQSAVTPDAADYILIGDSSDSDNLKKALLSGVNAIILSGFKDKVLSGLTLSNNGTDATNDIDIAAGTCVSDDGTTVMTLGSTYTKQSDVAWAVGSGQGALDTGAVGNSVYNVWIINRPDTGVTDVLFSLSASSPTMPTNYTKKKCIGAFIRSGGAILLFNQYGNVFQFVAPVVDLNTTNPGTSAQLRTLTVPPSMVANIDITMANITSAAAGYFCLVNAVAQTDVAPTAANSTWTPNGTGNFNACSLDMWIPASTSSQIRTRQAVSAGSDVLRIKTIGWKDNRI